MKVDINEIIGVQAPQRCRAVLLVDDEERILNSLNRLLRETYQIERTTSPETALELLKTREFAVMISDQRMPDMLGTELCARTASQAPDTVRVILTGHSDLGAALDAINRGAVYRFMLKPWKDDEMRALVREAVDRYALVAENRRLNELTERQNGDLKELNGRLKNFNAKLREKVFERTRQVTDLNQKVTKYFKGSVDVLARLSNMHSQVLGNHARRVAEISVKIGRERGMSEEDLTELELAASLHDVGKIGMDPNIVAKRNGNPSARDEGVLRTHPVTGSGLIQRIPGLDLAASMVRHHHERFDGSGFPDGLSGDSIPLGSRIIAVADAFDNFLNLHSRFTIAQAEAALQHVVQHSGTRFDPRVVKVLSRIVLDEDSVLPETDEVEITTKELRTGMVLSRDLVTARGIMLLQKGAAISDVNLARLLKMSEADPFVDGPFIYRGERVEAEA